VFIGKAIICDEACSKTPSSGTAEAGSAVCSYQEKAQLERTFKTPRRTLNTKIVARRPQVCRDGRPSVCPPGHALALLMRMEWGPTIHLDGELRRYWLSTSSGLE